MDILRDVMAGLGLGKVGTGGQGEPGAYGLRLPVRCGLGWTSLCLHGRDAWPGEGPGRRGLREHASLHLLACVAISIKLSARHGVRHREKHAIRARFAPYGWPRQTVATVQQPWLQPRSYGFLVIGPHTGASADRSMGHAALPPSSYCVLNIVCMYCPCTRPQDVVSELLVNVAAAKQAIFTPGPDELLEAAAGA